MNLTLGTICSGIGAPEEATEPLGWRPVYCSEIEPFPSAVLAHHRPDVPNLGDFTTIDGAEWPVDVIIGGPPCQAFSFAGGRLSLADARGNLTLSFVELLHATRSLRYGVFENVPGILSVTDNAFGCFLGALVGADAPLVPEDRVWGPRAHFDARSYDVHRTYGWKRIKWPSAGMASGPLGRVAWRVFDAQYFDLPQRRERVFAVFCPAGSLGDPAAVLFEPQGLHRHPPARGQPGEGPAGTLAARTSGGGGLGTDFDLADGLQPVAHTLRGEGFDASEDGTGRGTPIVPVAMAFGGGNRSGPVGVAATLTAKGNRQDFEVETFIAQPQPRAFDPKTLLAPHGSAEGSDIAYPLKATGHKDQQMVAFSSKDYGGDAQVDLSPTLRAGGHDGSHANAGVPRAIAFAMRGREEGNVPEVHDDGSTVGALRAADGGSTQPHLAQMIDAVRYAVRRLTPDECARLQGFPDGHSRIPWRGRPAEDCPDGPQYKTYGNSMAVRVITWLALRIEADAARVDAIRAPEAI